MLMNAKLFAAVLAMTALSLPGCKTTESAAILEPSAGPAAEKAGTTYDPRIVEDTAYISRVQRMALRRGVYVRWVNKPQKRIVDQTEQ
jgi:hypothetical protein